jgi:hypothetical protein
MTGMPEGDDCHVQNYLQRRPDMWPTMTFIVPGLLFLLFYPLASFAGEAEQEMQERR